jgi:hypothetical protein
MGNQKLPMKWNNAGRDKPLKDRQKVLISVNGIYYDAVYDAQENTYLPVKFSRIVFSPKEHQIYWTNLTSPE